MNEQLYELRARALKDGIFKNYCKEKVLDLEFIAKTVCHSASIEGNTMTEGDTLTLLKAMHTYNESETKDLEGEYQVREINEISDLGYAVSELYENLDNPILEEDFILNLHERACASDQSQDAGMYKTYNNFAMHRGEQKFFTPAREVARAMKALIRNYNSVRRKTLEDIAELVLEFIYIHPFADGNGRVSRLLLNWALITNNFPPVNIEMQEKDRYIELLDEYGDSQDVFPFSKFIEGKIIDVYTNLLGIENS